MELLLLFRLLLEFLFFKHNQCFFFLVSTVNTNSNPNHFELEGGATGGHGLCIGGDRGAVSRPPASSFSGADLVPRECETLFSLVLLFPSAPRARRSGMSRITWRHARRPAPVFHHADRRIGRHDRDGYGERPRSYFTFTSLLRSSSRTCFLPELEQCCCAHKSNEESDNHGEALRDAVGDVVVGSLSRETERTI